MASLQNQRNQLLYQIHGLVLQFTEESNTQTHHCASSGIVAMALVPLHCAYPNRVGACSLISLSSVSQVKDDKLLRSEAQRIEATLSEHKDRNSHSNW